MSDCTDKAHYDEAHDWRHACLKCGVFRGSDLYAEPDWEARAEAAEARVKELEARLTVTDEMVETAMRVPPIDGRGPNVFNPERMRAALTAALEPQKADT